MELTTILGLVSTLAVVAGLVLAGFQVRIAARQRSKDSQMILANSLSNPEFDVTVVK